MGHEMSYNSVMRESERLWSEINHLSMSISNRHRATLFFLWRHVSGYCKFKFNIHFQSLQLITNFQSFDAECIVYSKRGVKVGVPSRSKKDNELEDTCFINLM